MFPLTLLVGITRGLAFGRADYSLSGTMAYLLMSAAQYFPPALGGMRERLARWATA